jgi:hypothetical protein
MSPFPPFPHERCPRGCPGINLLSGLTAWIRFKATLVLGGVRSVSPEETVNAVSGWRVSIHHNSVKEVLTAPGSPYVDVDGSLSRNRLKIGRFDGRREGPAVYFGDLCGEILGG